MSGAHGPDGPHGVPLLAEDLFLLSLDDRGRLGRWDDHVQVHSALAGALLAELAAAGAITQSGRVGWGSVHPVTPPPAVHDPLLAQVLATFGRGGVRSTTAIRKLRGSVEDTIGARLLAAGAVRQEQGRRRLRTTTLWPVVATDRVAALRHTVGQVLTDGDDPDPRTMTLIGLLSVCGRVPRAMARSPFAIGAELVAADRLVGDCGWPVHAVRKANRRRDLLISLLGSSG